MTGEEKEVRLHNNRHYKKSIRETSTSSHHTDIAVTTAGSNFIQQVSVHIDQFSPCIHRLIMLLFLLTLMNLADGVYSHQDCDATGIFEPTEHYAAHEGKIK